jgi:hypothetical protein
MNPLWQDVIVSEDIWRTQYIGSGKQQKALRIKLQIEFFHTIHSSWHFWHSAETLYSSLAEGFRNFNAGCPHNRQVLFNFAIA